MTRRVFGGFASFVTMASAIAERRRNIMPTLKAQRPSTRDVVQEALAVRCRIGSNLGRKAMKIRSAAALALMGGFAIGAIAVQGLHAAGSAPAYVVTEIGISDLDAYQKEYVPLAQASIKALGAAS
jgi:hypothetical protein